MRYIISTIGTSILTNSINGATEGDWRRILGVSANLKEENDLSDESKHVITELTVRACKKLSENEVEAHRRASAELNGIYGIYGGTLPEQSDDQHYLICTDTFQGQTTGNLIKDFLEKQSFKASVVIPIGLSTKDTNSFTDGIKELIEWLESNVSWQRDSDSHKVIFNLVGGFKSLQGYMQTFGAFYADETVYIFEGSSELIKIPRLPIQIDTSVIEKHTLKFAMMEGDKRYYPIEELEGIPETLLEPIEDNDRVVAGLSAWGELIWNRTKSGLLSKEILSFPRLVYDQRFINDYSDLNSQQRTDLQETLAKIAVVLEDTDGNITELNQKVSGLNFEKLVDYVGICTFRINQAVRVSCKITTNGLNLRRYGNHDDVYNNP